MTAACVRECSSSSGRGMQRQFVLYSTGRDSNEIHIYKETTQILPRTQTNMIMLSMLCSKLNV